MTPATLYCPRNLLCSGRKQLPTQERNFNIQATRKTPNLFISNRIISNFPAVLTDVSTRSQLCAGYQHHQPGNEDPIVLITELHVIQVFWEKNTYNSVFLTVHENSGCPFSTRWDFSLCEPHRLFQEVIWWVPLFSPSPTPQQGHPAHQPIKSHDISTLKSSLTILVLNTA